MDGVGITPPQGMRCSDPSHWGNWCGMPLLIEEVVSAQRAVGPCSGILLVCPVDNQRAIGPSPGVLLVSPSKPGRMLSTTVDGAPSTQCGVPSAALDGTQNADGPSIGALLLSPSMPGKMLSTAVDGISDPAIRETVTTLFPLSDISKCCTASVAIAMTSMQSPSETLHTSDV